MSPLSTTLRKNRKQLLPGFDCFADRTNLHHVLFGAKTFQRILNGFLAQQGTTQREDTCIAWDLPAAVHPKQAARCAWCRSAKPGLEICGAGYGWKTCRKSAQCEAVL